VRAIVQQVCLAQFVYHVQEEQSMAKKVADKKAIGKTERIPFVMTKDELAAFDAARAKFHPLVTRSAVIRELISEYAKKVK
jgi:hypothetical protein